MNSIQANIPLQFRVASRADEFEQIHRLNHRCFCEEIPQYSTTSSGLLIDRFHSQNCYVIALQADKVLGMIALRDSRPLSLDSKVDDLESLLPPFDSILEYRLLAIDPAHRHSRVFGGIMKMAFTMAIDAGYDLAVISGTPRQIRLYRHLGFVPFGPLVGSE